MAAPILLQSRGRVNDHFEEAYYAGGVVGGHMIDRGEMMQFSPEHNVHCAVAFFLDGCRDYIALLNIEGSWARSGPLDKATEALKKWTDSIRRYETADAQFYVARLQRWFGKVEEATIALERARVLGFDSTQVLEEGRRLAEQEQLGLLLESNSKSACFPGNATILAPTGYRRIDAFQRGDIVLSWRGAAGDLVPRRVVRVLRHKPERVWTIDFQSDRLPLRATSRHSLLTVRGWVTVDELIVGDQLIQIDQCSCQKVTSAVRRVAASSEKALVYNLYTEGEHNFVVDGIVAHNFTYLRWLRVLAHRAFLDGSHPAWVRGRQISA